MFIVHRYMLAWMGMIPIAIANGYLRNETYGRFMPEIRAHQLSTLIGSAVLGVYIWFVVRAWRPESPPQALRLGAFWVVMTAAFELMFGHYIAEKPWPLLLREYDLFSGRLWLPFLVWIGLAPWIFLSLQRDGEGS